MAKVVELLLMRTDDDLAFVIASSIYHPDNVAFVVAPFVCCDDDVEPPVFLLNVIFYAIFVAKNGSLTALSTGSGP